MSEDRIIIRIYGIFIDPIKGLFISDELFNGKQITKFPGGGLEYGEGTIDCLKREMIEETGCEFEIISHFYTTDFFMESAFHPGRQIISVYYTMKPVGMLDVKISNIPFDFENTDNGQQTFRFISMNEISPDEFTFGIDRHVASLLAAVHR